MRLISHVYMFNILFLVLFQSCDPGQAAEETFSTQHYAQAGENESEIIADIDRLFDLQDLAARGKIEALEIQGSQIQKIVTSIHNNSPSSSPRLIYAIAAFVLSGGDIESADRYMNSSGLRPDQQKVLKAASEFKIGNSHEALELMETFDFDKLPLALKGRFALAKAQIQQDNTKVYQKWLAIAIASMPGTLIEESALRRSALAYAKSGNQAMAWKRLERYQRRFPRSLFASQFLEEILPEAAGWVKNDDDVVLSKLEKFIGKLELNDQKLLYVQLSREGAESPNPILAEFASGHLREVSQDNKELLNISLLYSGIFSILSDKHDGAMQQLNSIPLKELQMKDQAILLSALEVSSAIDRPLGDRKRIREIFGPHELSSLEKEGQRTLRDVDALLARAK